MANRKRNIQMKFYVTEDEKRLIDEKMSQLPTRRYGAYLRKMAIDGYIIYTDTADIKAFTKELSAIGRNINQIAKRINAGGPAYQADMDEIRERLDEIWQLQRRMGSFVVRKCKTLDELITEYVALYGKENWALSTYEGNVSLINNYILPIIGDAKLSEINTRFIERYYQSLLKRRAVINPLNKTSRNEFVSSSTVRDVNKLLRNCFEQAVKWELMEKNPCTHATVPKHKSQKRDIWTADIEYVLHCMTRISQQECRGILELKEDMKMSKNNDYIQLPPLKKDTPSDVVVHESTGGFKRKVKNPLKDANENGVKISHQAPTLYDVVPKEEIAEFEELMRKTINEMLQELPDVSQFILAMMR